VAADIVHTAAAEPTITSVAVLGIIFLIRTFLSFSLEVELTGRWPWQKNTTGPRRNGQDRRHRNHRPYRHWRLPQSGRRW